MGEAQTLSLNTRRTRSVVKLAAIAASAAIAILATTADGLAGNDNGNGNGGNNNGKGNGHSVPAPAIDTGIPAMILIAGVVVGTTLIRRRLRNPQI